MRFYAIILGVSIAVLSSCHSTENTNTTAKTAPPKIVVAPTSDLSPTGQAAFLDMMKPYFELKDALVATNAAKADAAASRLLSALEDTRRIIGGADSAQKTVVDTLSRVIKSTEALINLKDEKCEKKRAEFEHISDGVYSVASSVHLKNAGIFQQFCPMAFNDKGAHWLSDNEEIKNPYLPKHMLHCGEVKDTL